MTFFFSERLWLGIKQRFFHFDVTRVKGSNGQTTLGWCPNVINHCSANP